MDDANREMQKVLIEGIANKIEDAMERNEGRVPYGMVAKQIANAKKTCPSIAISQDHINNMLCLKKGACRH